MKFKAFAIALATVALAAACGPKATVAGAPIDGDAFLGPADAKVTVVEFGAPTCPACKAFHDANFERLKAEFIDTGKIKFVWRELPSHNPPVDTAIFAIARCSGSANYFGVLDEAYAHQVDIEKASRSAEGPRPELEKLGKKFGLDAAKVESCIKDRAIIDRIYAVQDMAEKFGVQGTPSFLVNDKLMQAGTLDGMYTELQSAINAGLGVAPATPAADTTAETPAPDAPAAPAPN
jgi:protein-disulfide isomerase